MIADITNCAFEVLGGIFIGLHCMRLYRDKEVRGADWRAVAYFSVWGFWNLFYYPHLDQWWSFAGGIVVAGANTVWVLMMLYYIRFERGQLGSSGLYSRKADLARRCQAYVELSK